MIAIGCVRINKRFWQIGQTKISRQRNCSHLKELVSVQQYVHLRVFLQWSEHCYYSLYKSRGFQKRANHLF
jgi:hypothetical protein